DSVPTTTATPRPSPPQKTGPAMEPAARTRAIKVVAIDEDSAVGDVAVMIEKDTVVIPIRSPVVPTPAKPAKEAYAKAETKRKTRTCRVQSRIPIPAWPDPDRLSIAEARIELRHLNNLRFAWFDHYGLSLQIKLCLRCAV